MCGKNLPGRPSFPLEPVSPPRVREKLLHGIPNRTSYGITPACAGKTWYVFGSYQIVRDHPRVCGKNLQSLLSTAGTAGSPPRVREKRWFIRGLIGYCGITPACAGKTKNNVKPKDNSQDHPRVCGKNAGRYQ